MRRHHRARVAVSGDGCSLHNAKRQPKHSMIDPRVRLPQQSKGKSSDASDGGSGESLRLPLF